MKDYPARLLWPDEPYQAFDAQGGRVIAIHYKADPEKTDHWAESARVGMPQTEWEREFEGIISSNQGQPVFPQYDPAIHYPESIRNKPLVCPPHGIDLLSWDCGVTRNIAVVALTYTSSDQIQVLDELQNEPGETMAIFSKKVHDWARRIFGHVGFVNVCDPAGAARTSLSSTSAIGIARQETGMILQPMTNAWHERENAVVWALTSMIEHNAPRIVFSSAAYKTRRGLGGMYVWREQRMQGSDHIIIKEPLKDEYSHLQDALQYGLIYIKRLHDKKGYEIRRSSNYSRHQPRSRY